MSRLAKPDLSRRRFLAGAVGGSCIMGLGLALPGCSPRTAVESLAAARPDATFAPSLWYEIDGTGATHIFITKAATCRTFADPVASDLCFFCSQFFLQLDHIFPSISTHPPWISTSAKVGVCCEKSIAADCPCLLQHCFLNELCL